MSVTTRWREPVTAALGDPPAMMTREELAACRRWARARSGESDARIVELGCFLGASTLELVRGAREGAENPAPVIVHDAFETQASMRQWIELPFDDGESFRPLFDLYTRACAESIDVREGRLPENLPVTRGATISPDADPVAMLFIDLAKTEGVSRSVLNAFAPRLEPGAIVLHQEIQYALYPWLGLHFSQIADAFEVVEDVPGWMVAVRCVRELAHGSMPEFHRLASMNSAAIEAAWDRAVGWWADCGAPGAASHMELQRIEHLRLVGDLRAAVRGAEGAALEPHSQLVENLDALIWSLGAHEKRDAEWGTLRETLEARRAELAADPSHDALWRAVAARCAAEGYRRVALAGGGSVCRRVLENGWPHGEMELACVLDEHPRPIPGVTVSTCDDAPAGIDAVVLCSTHYEPALRRMVASHDRFKHTSIVAVYSPSRP